MRREMGKLTQTVAGLRVQVTEMWSWVGELGESDYIKNMELLEVSEEDPEKEMGAEELEELLGEFERNNEMVGRRVTMVKEALEVVRAEERERAELEVIRVEVEEEEEEEESEESEEELEESEEELEESEEELEELEELEGSEGSEGSEE